MFLLYFYIIELTDVISMISGVNEVDKDMMGLRIVDDKSHKRKVACWTKCGAQQLQFGPNVAPKSYVQDQFVIYNQFRDLEGNYERKDY